MPSSECVCWGHHEKQTLGVAAGFLAGRFACGTCEGHGRIRNLYWHGEFGTDPGGVFGQSGSLSGQAYKVLYVFDTGNYSDNHLTENFVFGGTAFGTASPLVGPAVLTIGGMSVEISGSSVGEIQGVNNGPGAFSQQLHSAWDENGNVVESRIFDNSGGLPATITSPFIYHVSGYGGGSDFSAFGASGDLDVTTLVVSLTPPMSAIPEPSTWAMLILGFAGIRFMAYRRRSIRRSAG